MENPDIAEEVDAQLRAALGLVEEASQEDTAGDVGEAAEVDEATEPEAVEASAG